MVRNLLVLSLVACLVSPGFAASADAPAEPNVDIATAWWPGIENSWVPIGWKDHPLRFNVLHDGTLIAQPRRYPAYGQGVQLTFLPSQESPSTGSPSTQPYKLPPAAAGLSQGWTSDAAPVLWTRWRQDDLTFRKDIFAHIPGGRAVETSAEPLYAWIRLAIEEIAEDVSSDRCRWTVRINAPHMRTEMDRNLNLIVDPNQAAYPQPLKLEPAAEARAARHLLLDGAGKLRLAVLSDSKHQITFTDSRPARQDAYLEIEFPAAKGSHVDLLVPLTPVDVTAGEPELQLGRGDALAEANRFWSEVPKTAARVDTPEPLVNEAVRQSTRFAELVAERDPETGQYAVLTGSWHYEMLWATPSMMAVTMILDGLGHHPAADKYLEIFRQEQGTITPPGKAYRSHPGYLATPRRFTSVDWLTDHGAILYTVARHGLITGDEDFITRWTGPIIKACEFVHDFRAVTDHGGVQGIMPAAVPTDTGVAEQSVWNDGWCYKGVVTAARLLQRIHHPRADEFARKAAEYREVFLRALHAAMPNMPEWTDTAGKSHRYVPTALPAGGDLKFPFYLDTGPLFLVYAELVPADDELMRSALHYFRAGPNRSTYDTNGAWYQPVSLHREISSCEPCYSWNVFHAWQSGDRPMFLEGMYSLFTGALHRSTFIGCEHRGGISGLPFPLPIEFARLSVVDDQLELDHLHLLRLVPRAWLSSERPASFERIPTQFGPATLSFQLADNNRRLVATFDHQFRHAPKAISLHIPPLDTLTEVTINGRKQTVRPGEIIQVK